jgi:hypothetical protein
MTQVVSKVLTMVNNDYQLFSKKPTKEDGILGFLIYCKILNLTNLYWSHISVL